MPRPRIDAGRSDGGAWFRRDGAGSIGIGFTSGFSAGGSAVSLRNLGGSSTLVRVDGLRSADITLVDLARPHLYPLNMPLFRLVCFANGNDVHTVIVDGKVALRDRKPVFVNEERVLEAAQRECERLLSRAGLQRLVDIPARVWG